MSNTKTLRPQRIAAMREAMAELGRQCLTMRDTLRVTNDIIHQNFFEIILDRIELIVANEREGITQLIADDLINAKSALRRLRLPDIDPILEMSSPTLLALRAARGNIVESIETALEAAEALNFRPSDGDLGSMRVARRDINEKLIRLDERLRITQEAVASLHQAARDADMASNSSMHVPQLHLVNVHVKTLEVEIRTARFETQVGTSVGSQPDSDILVLTRSIEAMFEIGQDLKQATESLRDVMISSVQTAGRAVYKATQRSWQGIKTVVRWTRRKLITGHQIGEQLTKDGLFPGTGIGMVLPRVSTNSLAGLIEEVAAEPYNGRADLPHLADSLQMEIDDLFPIAETLQLMRFAYLDDGDITLTRAGRRFANAEVDARKKIFAKNLVSYVPLVARIKSLLDERTSHNAHSMLFLEELEEYMSEDYAEKTLRSAINWGRFGEVYSYDDENQSFSLENST